MKLFCRSFLILLLFIITIPTYAQDHFVADELYSFNYEKREFFDKKFNCRGDVLLGVPFRYCIRDLETTNNNDIVYFFHGLEGSEKTWFSEEPGTLWMQRLWRHQGYSPRIITISFGPQWLLVNNERYRLLPFVAGVVIPYLENKIGGLKSGQRHLIGESMGGFNAAEISLNYPGLFSRVALLCPAITTVGPYSSTDEIEKYILRTGATRKEVIKMLQISRSVFIDQKDWNNHDPLMLLKQYQAPLKPKYFVSVGLIDDYGFQEGAHRFYHLAHKHSFSAGWGPVLGGHCAYNLFGAAEFIQGDFL